MEFCPLLADFVVTNLMKGFQYIWSYFQPEPEPVGYLDYLPQVVILLFATAFIYIQRWQMNSIIIRQKKCEEGIKLAWQNYKAMKAQEIIFCNLNFGGDKKTPIGNFASDVNVKDLEAEIKTFHKCMEEERKITADLNAHIQPFLDEIGPLPEEMDVKEMQTLLTYFALYLQAKDKHAKIPGPEEFPYGYTESSDKTVITSSDDTKPISFEDPNSIIEIPENDDKLTRYDPHAISVISQAGEELIGDDQSTRLEEPHNKTVISQDSEESLDPESVIAYAKEEIIKFRKLLDHACALYNIDPNELKGERKTTNEEEQQGTKTHHKAKPDKFDESAPSIKLDEIVPPKERKSQ